MVGVVRTLNEYNTFVDNLSITIDIQYGTEDWGNF